MSTSIVTDPTASTQPITPQIDGQYLISFDIAPPHAGGFLRGVILRDDLAVSAYYCQDGAGEYLETAYDADDAPIPAPDGWEHFIVRPVGTPVPSPSPEGGAYPAPGGCRIFTYAAPHTVRYEVAA